MHPFLERNLQQLPLGSLTPRPKLGGRNQGIDADSTANQPEIISTSQPIVITFFLVRYMSFSKSSMACNISRYSAISDKPPCFLTKARTGGHTYRNYTNISLLMQFYSAAPPVLSCESKHIGSERLEATTRGNKVRASGTISLSPAHHRLHLSHRLLRLPHLGYARLVEAFSRLPRRPS